MPFRNTDLHVSSFQMHLQLMLASTVRFLCRGVATLRALNQQAAHPDVSSHCNALLGCDEVPKYVTRISNKMRSESQQHTASCCTQRQARQAITCFATLSKISTHAASLRKRQRQMQCCTATLLGHSPGSLGALCRMLLICTSRTQQTPMWSCGETGCLHCGRYVVEPPT